MNGTGQTVTVVSWNLNHWNYLDEGLGGEVDWDVALLQECRPPDGRDRPTIWQPVRDHDWGTAVTTRHAPLLQAVGIEDDSHPGCVVAAVVDLGARGTVTAVSLDGLQEFAKKIDGEPYPVRSTLPRSIRRIGHATSRRWSGSPTSLGRSVQLCARPRSHRFAAGPAVRGDDRFPLAHRTGLDTGCTPAP